MIKLFVCKKGNVQDLDIEEHNVELIDFPHDNKKVYCGPNGAAYCYHDENKILEHFMDQYYFFTTDQTKINKLTIELYERYVFVLQNDMNDLFASINANKDRQIKLIESINRLKKNIE